MARRLALGLALVLLLAAPVSAGDIVDKKRAVDERISSLNGRVERAREREAALRGEISSVSAQIHTLVRQVGDVSTRLVPLEHELRLRELKLNRLDTLFQIQTERLQFLRREYAIALRRLNARLVSIYESDEPDAWSVILSAQSFADLLDGIDYVRRVGEQDKRISDEFGSAKKQVAAARARTRVTRARSQAEARVIAARVAQVRELRDRLLASRQQLAGARAQQQQRLADLTEAERQDLSEMEALQQVSAELAAKIRAAQARTASSSAPADTTPSAAGFIWPVTGPITSPFGWRWGRMHEGIDIGAPEGAPIHAVAAGTVIYAGWLGGYGNLVVIDHGGGFATAYGHQSGVAVSTGQGVSQGQVIGYVGSTGHSFGPHLHFEVRVNGAPVDPLGYL